MPTFEATVRVVHMELWVVDAATADEAKEKMNALTPDVETDDAGGEIIDWEVYKLKQVADD